MENDMATIQCSNASCLTPNAYQNRFCSQCGTPIVRRYLRGMGNWLKVYQLGELIDERYLLKPDRVLLDTQPGVVPLTPDEVPSHILPYLKLFSYRLHIPQVYGYLPSLEEQIDLDIWLLEYSSLPLTPTGDLQYEDFLPQLTQLWQEANPLRQLNWLWQIANLWQPLQSQGAASSLLDPSLVRVNGPIVQLLELAIDPDSVPTLTALGQLWRQWVEGASPSLRDFLQHLCQNLEEGEISHIDRLIALLEQAIEYCARSQKRSYQVFTNTDVGLRRELNEDSCYPPPKQALEISNGDNVLSLVCDGIGGQEGGEVASKMAIETLLESIGRLTSTDLSAKHSFAVVQALEKAILSANDYISDRNDRENRQNRQRMGTTVVMGFSHAHQMFCAHVGDSRIYWITPTNCYQISVDDDLASREVKLGYLLYREAVQYPNSGSLVQALGMSSSSSLHPNIEPIVLDEDCVFLLCSDGLSDYDRVEQYWESDILPLLAGEKPISEVGERLIQIANEQNGHDNVTIALIYCQVQATQESLPLPLSFSEIDSDVPSLPQTDLTEEVEEISTSVPTQPFAAKPLPQPQSRKVPWLAILPIALIALAGIGYGLKKAQIFSSDDVAIGDSALELPLDTDPISPPSPPPRAVSPVVPRGESFLYEGEFIENLTALTLTSLPKEELDESNQVKVVPPGKILKVLQKEPDNTWVQLQICQTAEVQKPTADIPENESVSPENTGWLRVNGVDPLNFRELPVPSETIGECVVSPSQ